MKISANVLFLVLALPLVSLAQEGMKEQPAAPTPAEESVPAETAAPAAKPVAAPRHIPAGERPRDLDLRHCLNLGDNAAIARCAYE